MNMARPQKVVRIAQSSDRKLKQLQKRFIKDFSIKASTRDLIDAMIELELRRQRR